MKRQLRKLLQKLAVASFGDFSQEIQKNRVLTARALIDQLYGSDREITLAESEFTVFSQWGEDGIIQYLIHNLAIENDTFVEFGVEAYLEANTRFLLINDNWKGLVIDGDPENVAFIKSDPVYWRHDLKVDCEFITRDNIDEILTRNGISGDIGLLSVDIDGNDYWVWDSIGVVSPRIVVCEYNSIWGDELAVTTPYDSAFVRTSAHYSNLYFGASIAALTGLAKAKGYSLVGSNKAGNNLFFVRNDLLGKIPLVTPGEAWVQSRFRESRDVSGQLSYLSFSERLELLADLPLVNLADGKQYKIGDLYGPG